MKSGGGYLLCDSHNKSPQTAIQVFLKPFGSYRTAIAVRSFTSGPDITFLPSGVYFTEGKQQKIGATHMELHRFISIKVHCQRAFSK